MKDQVQSPVECDAQLFLKSRKLHQIDSSPEPPGEESREVQAEDLSDAGASTEGRELSDGLEHEGFLFTSANCSPDVVSEDLSLP